MNDVDRRLEEIDARRNRREYDIALRLCNKLLEECPDSHRVLRERAFLYGSMHRTELAIDDLTRVIALRPNEPCYFADRADYLIDARRYREAVDDLTEALRLCDVWRNDYYRATAHFVRAYAHLRLGHSSDALADCRHVRDNFSWWIEGALRSKSGIVTEAEVMQANGERADGGL